MIDLLLNKYRDVYNYIIYHYKYRAYDIDRDTYIIHIYSMHLIDLHLNKYLGIYTVYI